MTSNLPLPLISFSKIVFRYVHLHEILQLQSTRNTPSLNTTRGLVVVVNSKKRRPLNKDLKKFAKAKDGFCAPKPSLYKVSHLVDEP